MFYLKLFLHLYYKKRILKNNIKKTMGKLLTSKKKISVGVWDYRGYVITKDELASVDKTWAITKCPENKVDLLTKAFKTIKMVCELIDSENGELTEDEKPKLKENKPKTKKSSKKHLEKTQMTDKIGEIFAQFWGTLKEDGIYYPSKTERGKTIKYAWGEKSKSFKANEDRLLPSKEEMLNKYNELAESLLLKYRTFKIVFDGETLAITYLE